MGSICYNQNIDLSIQGFDVSHEYLSIAKERLKNVDPDKLKLVLGDFLELITLTKFQLSLEFLFDDSISLVNNSADVVIANPPYVRTQILGFPMSDDKIIASSSGPVRCLGDLGGILKSLFIFSSLIIQGAGYSGQRLFYSS